MKFAIEAISKNSGRLGCITKSETCSVKTPLVLHYTRAGSIPHLSREVYDCLNVDQKALEITVETTNQMHASLKAFKKGITAFTGLDDHISFVTLRDPGTVNQWFHSQTEVSIVSRSGKMSLTPQGYVKLMESLQPDIFHTLCDGDTSENCAKKRVQNATKRTAVFFADCMEQLKTSETLNKSMVIAPIEGGYNLVAREEFIKDLDTYEDRIGGYFLDGFHSGGETATNVTGDNVKEIVTKCISLLKEEKLRCMLGAYSPLLIAQLVQLGIDVFDTSYAYLATVNNRALIFNFDVSNTAKSIGKLYIDLSDQIYKEDFEPYSKQCACLACQKHTRAYTHHLVKTNELLGPILLMIHNTHHFLEFFKSVRQSIAADTLPNLIELLESQSPADDVPQTKENP